MYRTGRGLQPTLNPNPSQVSSLKHGIPHSVLGKLLRFLKDKAHWGFPFPSSFATALLSLLFLILSQGPTVSFLTAYAWFTLHGFQSCQIFVPFTLHNWLPCVGNVMWFTLHDWAVRGLIQYKNFGKEESPTRKNPRQSTLRKKHAKSDMGNDIKI